MKNSLPGAEGAGVAVLRQSGHKPAPKAKELTAPMVATAWRRKHRLRTSHLKLKRKPRLRSMSSIGWPKKPGIKKRRQKLKQPSELNAVRQPLAEVVVAAVLPGMSDRRNRRLPIF